MEKKEFIYEGKAKQVYKTEKEDERHEWGVGCGGEPNSGDT